MTTAGVANADPNNPSDSDKAAARPFAIEGLRLAQAGSCKEAAEQLEKAEALVHAPTTAVPLAQCEIQLGKIIAGTELLNRVLNESLPPNAPPSWADAKKQARTILDAAEPKVAKLRIHVEVPAGVTLNPEVTVDGQPVPKVLLDNDRPTDPGPHHIAARQAGVGAAETDVSLTPGQMLPVDLRLAGGAAATTTTGTPDPYGTGTVPTPAAGAAAADAGAPWMAFEFGLRFAFGLPFGSSIGGNGNDLDHEVSNQFVPLWLDAGLRFASNWYVGAYFSYGIASVSNQFTGGATAPICNLTGVGCSANVTRLGIDAAYHVFPDGRLVDPWFGLGFGYEWGSLAVTADAAASGTGAAISRSGGSDGWEFVNLNGGVDFRFLNGALGAGPFITFTMSQYDHQSVASDNNGGTTGQSIQNQALHEWFLMGIRGDYDLKF
jgi:hypothetical protein